MEKDELLTEFEIAKLVALNADKVLVEALRKIFLVNIYGQGVLKKGEKSNPLQNAALALVSKARTRDIGNEALGADLKALWEGLQAVEMAFDYLANLSETKVEKTEETNEAI